MSENKKSTTILLLPFQVADCSILRIEKMRNQIHHRQVLLKLIKIIGKGLIAAFAFCLFPGALSPSFAQTGAEVKIVGKMSNVMRKGQLYGTIRLDTIAKKEHLFGLGPMAYLKGELVIYDGQTYRATVVNRDSMKVEKTSGQEAPFFAYANIAKWKAYQLPDSVQTLPQLEKYLDKTTKTAARPLLFRISGLITKAKVHVLNLPEGTKVSSPEEAHQGQIDYIMENQEADILGFFSTNHQSIFTRHDTFLHMHLITGDRKKMGHLDEMKLTSGKVRLYLPAD